MIKFDSANFTTKQNDALNDALRELVKPGVWEYIKGWGTHLDEFRRGNGPGDTILIAKPLFSNTIDIMALNGIPCKGLSLKLGKEPKLDKLTDIQKKILILALMCLAIRNNPDGALSEALKLKAAAIAPELNLS